MENGNCYYLRSFERKLLQWASIWNGDHDKPWYSKNRKSSIYQTKCFKGRTFVLCTFNDSKWHIRQIKTDL